MPEQSLHYQLISGIRDEIVGKINDGTISGIPATNCAIMQVAHDDPDIIDSSLAAIIVSPGYSEQFDGLGAMNDADVITYPVLIAVIDPANMEQGTRFDQRRKWRETLYGMFIHNIEILSSVTKSGVDGVDDVEIEFSETINPEAWFEQNAYLSEITVNVTVSKKRRV